MKRIREIGSIFCLSQEQMTLKLEEINCRINFLSNDEKEVFTSSGRGAIKHLSNNLKGKKIALLPNYTCDSVIMPFNDCDFQIHYYRIKNDMTVDTDDLLKAVKKYSPSVLYIQDYYGFNTLTTLRPYYEQFKSQGLTIVKDFTHSWLSDFNEDDVDYYIASLHKWFEIPDGGIVISNKCALPGLKSGKGTNRVSEFIYRCI